MGEAIGKCAISTKQGNGTITYIQHSKFVSKKLLLSIMGLVIGRIKNCYVNMILSIIKSKVITLIVMTFILVGSVTSNCSLFCISPVR